MKNPPFEINSKILTLVLEIGELIGKVNVENRIGANPVLRRKNRIRTIYSSLAIEQNSLDIEQVTAVIHGKHIIAPPKDIAEVLNAYEIYEHMDMLDPYSETDLLKAHGVMVRDLVGEAGQYRTRPVGIVDGAGNIIHFGTLPQYVPGLVEELLEWVKTSEIHILIKSCVFHYELELIHPFADGNGRIGRLWHTLLLSKWNPLFAWLPIESIIHDNQQGYYDAINLSNSNGESTAFIEFMLGIIKEALLQVADGSGVTEEIKDKKVIRENIIFDYLQSHNYICNKDVQLLLGVSSATATRLLTSLATSGKLRRIRAGKQWAYENK